MVGIKFLKIFKEQKDIFIKNLPVQVIIFIYVPFKGSWSVRKK